MGAGVGAGESTGGDHTWSMFGAEPGPTDLLREKSLESRDSPGESEAWGRVVEAERSFSEERRMDQDRLSLSFSLRDIVLRKLRRPESSPLLQHHGHPHPGDHHHHVYVIMTFWETFPWPGRS